MLRREKVSKSCDVYSYGVLVFEMATQQVPFPDVVPIVAAVMTMEGKVGDSVTLGNAPIPFRVCLHVGHQYMKISVVLVNYN